MRKYKDVLLYKILRPVITFLFKVLYRPKILGTENIPKNGRIILAGNHTHNLDCAILISSTKRNIHFLAKVELFKGFKKILFSNMGLIPVNRKIKDHNVLVHAYNYLENEKVIGIFPEGTHGKGKILPFKIGAVKMAYETKSDIVPFAITGTYKILSNDLKIVFGKPIKIESNNLDKENKKLRNIVVKMAGDNDEYI
ncbi:MAG: 1-acyl-sn-glycerol-3-phosphate acyltransferase [Firmicutes bacterium]|nr:1-acyl-sn-glycerol-3-phosphate acyltransferase [Bacillota bacterium]